MNTIAEETEATDEEKGFLLDERYSLQSTEPAGLSRAFWFGAGVNTASTVAIIFVNKRIFEDQSLKHAQVTFAASHFAMTAVIHYVASRPQFNVFQANRVGIFEIMPLSLAMIFNVLFGLLATPGVAMLNYVLYGATFPGQAALTLIPICAGVAIVSYCETMPTATSQGRETSPLGVFFAFAGILASALYTIWIGRYHKLLDCTSMQLLLNQAPVSVLLALYIIPFSDDVTIWSDLPLPTWILILFSGILACFINISQFVVIREAGPVSSTVVGHFKICSIFLLGWIYSGKPVRDGSLFGILLAAGGIISFSIVMQRHKR